MLTVNQIKDTMRRLGQKYGVKNAYLFGSYAKGSANDDSDVDIIIDRGAVRTYDQYFDLRHELETELQKDVDLLATDGVRPRFFENIKNDRVLLYGIHRGAPGN